MFTQQFLDLLLLICHVINSLKLIFIYLQDFSVNLGAICCGDPQKKLSLLYRLHLLPTSDEDLDEDLEEEEKILTPTSTSATSLLPTPSPGY